MEVEIVDVVAVGGGPAGIAVAIEARAVGLNRAVVLEKGAASIAAIRQFYPEKKMTLANYKGLPTKADGLLTIPDMNKPETLIWFDELIREREIDVRFGEEAYDVQPAEHPEGGAGYRVVTSRNRAYFARAVTVGIGILGRPNKPSDYKLVPSLKNQLLFDLTSQPVENCHVLVVGGGDTAAEYCEYLPMSGNTVTLSYRQHEFKRLLPRNLENLTAAEAAGAVRILRGSNIDHLEDDGGRPRVFFKEENHLTETFDRVLFALGGTTPTNYLKTIGVPFGEDGTHQFDPETGEVPGRSGLYLIGDLVLGRTGGSIITAFNSAHRAIQHLRARLDAETAVSSAADADVR